MLKLPQYRKETVTAESEGPRDPDWYENREAYRRSGPAEKSVREKIVVPGVVDPTRGFLELVEIMERHGW
jgi:hypothetical protein